MLNVTTAIGAALLAFSALSFLGLGVQPPFYDWGRMLNEGLGRIYVNPAGALAPGAAIVLAGLTFNLLGEGLAQVASGRHGSSRRSARRHAPRAGRRADAADDADDLVLDVGGLSVTFPIARGDVHAVRDVALAVRRGEIVGIVGESGSGKTVTALAIAQLVSYPGVVTVEQLPLRRPRTCSTCRRASVAGCWRRRCRWCSRTRARRSTRQCGSAASSPRCPRSTTR